MGKSCGSTSCGATSCSGSQSSPSPPGPPKSSKASGASKMATASVDTIDTSPSSSPLKNMSSACPPGCDGRAVAGPSGIRKPTASKGGKGGDKSGGSTSSPNSSSDFSYEFMDNLVSFMNQSYKFMNKWKETKGQEEYSMSDTERMHRIQELLSMIAQKEAELSALEAQRDALDSSAGSGEVTSYYNNPYQRSAGNSCNVSCQATCSPSSVGRMTDLGSSYSDILANTADISPYSTPVGVGCSPCSFNNTSDMVSKHSDINTIDIMSSGYASSGSPPSRAYPRAPPNSRYDYSGEMERSMHDYSNEEECQANCTDSGGDILNVGFYEDNYDDLNTGFIEDSCDGECNDDSGDILNTGFVDYESQKYTPVRSQGYAPPQQQYAPQRYASPQSSPQQYTQSYTQAVSNVPTRSSMSGRSASSCYCPPELQTRSNKKR